MLVEYFPVLVFLMIATGIALALAAVPFVASRGGSDDEKNTAYECGFDAFDSAHGRFDVRFYLVAILFIIFDLEVAFLFPWAVTFGTMGLVGFVTMMIFLLILTIGFIYEWKKGALDWD